MNLDLNTVIAGLFVSTIGFVLLRYGKSLERIPHIVTGVILMLFPYFAGGVLPMLCIAAGLMAALWVGVRLGL
jgi:hypothetical protein